MVDYNGLENRRAERHRGFESLSLRERAIRKGCSFCMMRGKPKIMNVVRNFCASERRAKLAQKVPFSCFIIKANLYQTKGSSTLIGVAPS